MSLHNRPRLEFHEAHQHVLPGSSENVHARKDGMLAASGFIDKIGTHSGWSFQADWRIMKRSGRRRTIAPARRLELNYGEVNLGTRQLQRTTLGPFIPVVQNGLTSA